MCTAHQREGGGGQDSIKKGKHPLPPDKALPTFLRMYILMYACTDMYLVRFEENSSFKETLVNFRFTQHSPWNMTRHCKATPTSHLHESKSSENLTRSPFDVCTYACVCMCVHVCACVCMCVHVCACVCI